MKIFFEDYFQRIFVTVNFCSCLQTVTAKQRFIVSFQSDGSWSTDNWIKYSKEIINVTNDFTICHWEKVRYFAPSINVVWSYCYPNPKSSGPPIHCTTFDHYYETAGRYLEFYAHVGRWESTAKNIKYRHRQWNHICFSYSVTNKVAKFYHNGNSVKEERSGNFIRFDQGKSISKSAFIIGQEQDVMEGGYDGAQLFNGEISELNMWNYLISEEEIRSLATCSSFSEGNVLSWDKNYFTMNRVDVIDVKDNSLFCKTRKRFFIFPQRRTFRRAKALCNIHGARLALPSSREEEIEIWSIVDKHKKLCLVAPRNIEEGKAVWLGMERKNLNWYVANTDNESRTDRVNYTNWDSTKCTFEDCGRPNIGCPYIQTNKKWAFALNTGMCSILELCTVCSFEETPVFTIKGTCSLDTQLDWNYYLVINETQQISAYDGFKSSQLRDKNGIWTFKDIGVSAERFSSIPIGRYRWKYNDRTCPMKASVDTTLTFSKCSFGEQFTCDSGQCIAIHERCNGINECDDDSDENGCTLVDIPNSYDKLISPVSFKEPRGTISLLTHVEIVSVDTIDTTKMLIGITFKIGIKWIDGRLRFQNLDSNGRNLISKEATLKLWLPSDNIHHDNAILGEIVMDDKRKVGVTNLTVAMPGDTMNSVENYIYEGSQAQLFIEQRFKITYRCIFELAMFPFDSHICNFTMKLDVQKSNLILFTEDDTPILYEGPTTVGQFEISEVASKAQNDGCSPKFMFSLTIRRFVTNQMLSTFLPTFLLWCLGYATLFIDIENFTDRFIGTITALLVLAALLSSVNEDLPKTSYFKFIDIWFLYYITNILLIIMFHILISQICSNVIEDGITMTSIHSSVIRKNTRRQKTNTMAKVGFALSTVAFVGIYFNLTT